MISDGRLVSVQAAVRWSAFAGLLAVTVLPVEVSQLATLGFVVLLGVPHGALDGEVARPILQPRFGSGWFVVFAVPYLCLAACVFAAWRLAPLPTLAAFLGASVWHFGTEDAGHVPLGALVAGGLPIAVPVLLKPAATAHLFGVVAQIPMSVPPWWLSGGAAAWCIAAIVWAVLQVSRRHAASLLESTGLLFVFAVLPPLTGFAVYFVCLHAPRHMAGLIADVRVERVADGRSAVARSVPITALTLLIGVGLWRFFPGPAPDRMLSLTIEGLSALTLPHILLNDVGVAVAARSVSPRAVRRPVRPAGGGWRPAGR